MRIAAIDIGTNSLHMIVVRVRPDLSFEVIDREKEMVRLGAGGLDGRALTPEAMHAALQVLSKFRRLADSHRVDEIIAVATSATREAENGSEFLQAIVAKTGIRARVISGTEEARLIHQAAVYGVGIAGDVAIVIDIGGGSVEITRGSGPNMETGRSFKLGVIRLTERFIKSDPLTPRDERKLRRYIDGELGKYASQLARDGFDRVIGTSGTIQSLGAVALAERCNYWPEHAQQVARLAVALFDQTRIVHGLTDREREWLEYAALLHDIGVHISYERHHKHSYYLIKNGDLRGFDPEEIEVIALVARYHRQATPKRRHEEYSEFGRKRRLTIRTLAAILRLAESLDRSHSQPVSGLELHDRGDDGLLQLRTSGDAELELWAATRHAAAFERLIGKPLRVEVSGNATTAAGSTVSETSHVEQSHHAARVSGEAVRRRGHRRVGKDNAAGAAGEVADRRGTPRVRHGMELVRAREGGDENRQEEERADADDVQLASRH